MDVLKPQIDAIDSSVDLVIMTMGGNDVRFDEIVTQCFVVGPRDPAGCREAVENARTDLADVEKDLIDTFAAIRSKLRPDAKVVLVSYPYLSLDVDYKLKKGDDIYDAAKEVRALGLEGDRRQKAAVDAANAAAGEEYIVFYDEIKEIFEGHEPDPSALSRNPDRWIYEFETTVKSEWYHYNSIGHQNIGSELSIFETFGAIGGSFTAGANIDVAFVVDTTGSMGVKSPKSAPIFPA